MKRGKMLQSEAGLRWQYGACASQAGYPRLQTHTGCVTFIAFTLQQWLHERASMLRYTYIASFFFRRIERDMVKNVYWSWKNLLFLSDFNKILMFSIGFRKMLKYQISWKSVQWESSWSMRKDRQAERHDETNGGFTQFCESD